VADLQVLYFFRIRHRRGSIQSESVVRLGLFVTAD